MSVSVDFLRLVLKMEARTIWTMVEGILRNYLLSLCWCWECRVGQRIDFPSFEIASHRRQSKILLKYIERESYNKQNIDFAWMYSFI